MNDLAAQPMLALALPQTNSLEEWSDLGRKLCSGVRAMNWLIGDWMIAGTERYGEKAREEANAIFRSDVSRFDPIMRTCRRFPEPKRHTALTFGHHLAVMSVPDDFDAEQLLRKAEQERLTTAALRAEARVRVPQAALVDDDPDDTAMRAIAQAWNRAPRISRQAFLELAQESSMGIIDL